MPGINKLPLKVLGTIGTLVLVNVVVWAGVGVVLVSLNGSLLSVFGVVRLVVERFIVKLGEEIRECEVFLEG